MNIIKSAALLLTVGTLVAGSAAPGVRGRAGHPGPAPDGTRVTAVQPDGTRVT
ncbi:hypothetical protein ABZ379_09030 [Streptomyces canus]|uniref:hypothetical protein n=1 Tax=Streptomyces canus TaxID=58343 RepID=UPI0033F6FC35